MKVFTDTKKYGALDNFSAFKFENHMTYIKRLIRKYDQPLQQIQKRLVELAAVDFFNEKLKSRGTSLKGCHSLGPIDDAAPPVVGQYNSIHNDVFSIRCLSAKDNCVRLRDGTVVSVKNILDCI